MMHLLNIHKLTKTLQEWEEWSNSTPNPRFTRGNIAAYANGLTVREREYLAERSNNRKVWLQTIADFSPGLTDQEREWFRSLERKEDGK